MKTLLVLTFLFLLPAFPAGAAPGCNCLEASFPTRWAGAGAVFTGTVEDIAQDPKFLHPGAVDAPVQVTFRVAEAFKGVEIPAKGEKDEARTFVLHTSLTRETCAGYPFERGRKYLVFAYARTAGAFEYWSLYPYASGTYGTGGLCGGIKPFEDSGKDLAEIAAALKGVGRGGQGHSRP